MTNWTPQSLIDAGALVVVNHSGGKDSQAQLIKLLEIVPKRQIVVVHASLGDIEWHGAKELAEKQAADAGVHFIVAHAFWKNGEAKDFLGMVEKRFADKPGVASWPSQNARYCTSDLKRDPINREVRRYAKRAGFNLILNCEGIRAAESTDRASRQPFHVNERLDGEAGRIAFTWYPIFDLTTSQVFQIIRDAGQEPHPMYALGNERLSCVFCVFASKGDLANGAKYRPDLLARFTALEKATGYTMHAYERVPLAELAVEAQRLAQAA